MSSSCAQLLVMEERVSSNRHLSGPHVLILNDFVRFSEKNCNQFFL